MLNSRRKRGDTTSTSHTPVHGVSRLILVLFLLLNDARAKSSLPAHRALIVRKLKGLEDVIPFTAVHWEMLEKGTSDLVALDQPDGHY